MVQEGRYSSFAPRWGSSNKCCYVIYIFRESEVKHPVGFVQNKNSDAAQVHNNRAIATAIVVALLASTSRSGYKTT